MRFFFIENLAQIVAMHICVVGCLSTLMWGPYCLPTDVTQFVFHNFKLPL